MELELRINGVTSEQDVAPQESLITLLRREGYCSVKHGCGTGDCGACTVLVDDVPRPSCVMLAAQAGGCSLTTVEGLKTGASLHPLQAAFVEAGAAPCGFCTPGMLLSAYALLKSNPSPSETDVRDALSGNICRCSGYTRPVQAVLRAAAVLRGETLDPLTFSVTEAQEEVAEEQVGLTSSTATEKVPHLVASAASANSDRATARIPAILPGARVTNPRVPAVPFAIHALPKQQLSVVGKPVPARNAIQMVTGKGAFVDDLQPQGVLYGRILTSPHASAIIRNISVTEAKALSGVHAVLTYKDVPRVPYSRVERIQEESALRDQYCLDHVVRYVGDRVAAVVADSPELAERALRLIEVEYEVQTPVLDPRLASEPTSVQIHPEEESRGIFAATRNIAAHAHFDVGDVEKGFAEADHIVEAEYVLPATNPASLEPDAVITYFDPDDTLVVRTNCQVPSFLRHTLARLLNIPLRRVRIVTPHVGGHFGSRQEIASEDVCAFLTLVTRRPVKMLHSQHDHLNQNHLRAQHILRMKTGVKADGTIVANQMVLLADTGAYGTHRLISPGLQQSSLALYPCSHIRFVAEVLYTNHPPAIAMQGYELAPEFFALESHMDDVARTLSLDPFVLRRKNMLKNGDVYPLFSESLSRKEQDAVVDASGLAACLKLIEEKLHWPEKRGQPSRERFRHGIGVALSLHGHPGPIDGVSGAVIKLNEDGSFDIFASHNENGSGLTTFVTQIAAETLGSSIDDIHLYTADTDHSPFEAHANDVTALYSSGGAIKKAAEQIRRQILTVAGRMLNVLPEVLKLRDGIIKSSSGQQLTIAQVAAYSLYVENRQIMTTSGWKGLPAPIAFAAQGVEVEVDMETGSIRIVKVVSAVDVGCSLNPLLLEAQIEGAMTQALAIGINEEVVFSQTGEMLTPNLRQYHLLTATEIPPLEIYQIETRPPSDLFHVKSAVSVPFYGVPAALANALHDAADIRLRQVPITPERTLRAIHAMMAKRSSSSD